MKAEKFMMMMEAIKGAFMIQMKNKHSAPLLTLTPGNFGTGIGSFHNHRSKTFKKNKRKGI